MIIYLPFLCCQPSSAITTIVINEGSIYQPASPRFLFLPLVSTALLLYLTPVQFTLFLHLFLPPPSIHPIHPSIPHSHSARSRLFVSAGEGWDAACHPRETPIQAAGGGPAAVNQSVERKQREWGLTCDVDPCCLEIHFFFSSSYQTCTVSHLFWLLTWTNQRLWPFEFKASPVLQTNHSHVHG